jgi:hypothetical protein
VQLKGIGIPVEFFCWGDAKPIKRSSKNYVAIGVTAGLLVGGGIFLKSTIHIPENTRFGGTPSNHSARSKSSDTNNAPSAQTADEELDAAFDEVWKEKDDFDRERSEAIKTLNPKLVIDWISKSPMSKREMGQRELEHWSLIVEAVTEGRKLAGPKATPREISDALRASNNDGLSIALKAFDEEYLPGK